MMVTLTLSIEEITLVTTSSFKKSQEKSRIKYERDALSHPYISILALPLISGRGNTKKVLVRNLL